MDDVIIFDPLGELLKVANQIEEQRKENERGSENGLQT